MAFSSRYSPPQGGKGRREFAGPIEWREDAREEWMRRGRGG